MKNKKILFLLLFVLIIIILLLFLIIKKFVTIEENNLYEEYTPQEEISSNQMRKTVIKLYYLDEENSIKSEGKYIDSTLLIQNPYKEIVSLLLEKPNSKDLKSPFPANTRILDAKIDGNCVLLNFSEELLNFVDDTQKYNIINCLLNTLSNLNEVNSIKININNENNEKFNEEYKTK